MQISLIFLTFVFLLSFASAETFTMEELMDDDAIMGDPNAPITMIEWADYQCPFCKKFYDETLPLIKEKYVDSGKINFVFRDYPLSFHPDAHEAAEAAECAGEQGKYYEMHDMIYDNEMFYGERTYDWTEKFKQYAKTIGLDSSDFSKCLEDNQMEEEITKDLEDGANVGMTGTPGFIINGKLVMGAQPYEKFEEIIEKEIKNGPVGEFEIKEDWHNPNPELDNCQSCVYENSCIPYGYRLMVEGQPSYCDISDQLLNQKREGESCQNDFECVSGQCINLQCGDFNKEITKLENKIDENTNAIQKLLNLLKRIFG